MSGMKSDKNGGQSEGKAKTQFKPGNPGGPGRPHKSETYNDVTREMLEAQKIDIKLIGANGKESHIFLESDKSLMHSVIAGQIKEALRGDTSAATHLADRAYGKVSDKLILDDSVPKTIILRVVEANGKRP